MFADNASFDGTQRGGKMTANGQLWIGSGASPHVRVGSLGSSDGSITWTVGNGTITGQVTGGATKWNDVVTATQTIAVKNAYVTDRGGGVTYTLPVNAAFGDEFKITGKSGLWTLAQNAGQQVLLGSGSSTVGVGGSLAATNAGDSISLVCITAGASTVWRCYSAIGNITVT